eukprot:362778-Chlamydomonas_euryale.AAC.2
MVSLQQANPTKGRPRDRLSLQQLIPATGQTIASSTSFACSTAHSDHTLARCLQPSRRVGSIASSTSFACSTTQWSSLRPHSCTSPPNIAQGWLYRTFDLFCMLGRSMVIFQITLFNVASTPSRRVGSIASLTSLTCSIVQWSSPRSASCCFATSSTSCSRATGTRASSISRRAPPTFPKRRGSAATFSGSPTSRRWLRECDALRGPCPPCVHACRACACMRAVYVQTRMRMSEHRVQAMGLRAWLL